LEAFSELGPLGGFPTLALFLAAHCPQGWHPATLIHNHGKTKGTPIHPVCLAILVSNFRLTAKLKCFDAKTLNPKTVSDGPMSFADDTFDQVSLHSAPSSAAHGQRRATLKVRRDVF
jgi:hypothetical protein